MKITELLERAGDGLKHQRLDGSFVSMRQKKAHAEITFSTEPEVASQLARSVMTGKAADYVGIVVWVPATAWNASPNIAVSHAGRTGPGSPCGPSPGVAL